MTTLRLLGLALVLFSAIALARPVEEQASLTLDTQQALTAEWALVSTGKAHRNTSCHDNSSAITLRKACCHQG
jgi:hypothetical protein